jgi:hypothetical protein
MHIPLIYQVDYTEIAELFNLLKQTIPLNLKNSLLLGLHVHFGLFSVRRCSKKLCIELIFELKCLELHELKTSKRYRLKSVVVAHVLTKAFDYAFQIWLDSPFHKW